MAKVDYCARPRFSHSVVWIATIRKRADQTPLVPRVSQLVLDRGRTQWDILKSDRVPSADIGRVLEYLG